MASGPITSWQTDGGQNRNDGRFYFRGLKNHCGHWLQPWIKRCLLLGKKAMIPRHCIKKHRRHFADKSTSGQSYGFSNSHVQMWDLDHKEGWGPKNWCFQTMVLEKTLQSPLDSKEIQWVNPKGNQPSLFPGRTDADAQVLWPPDVNSQLTRKYPDAGKDWGQEEKGTTEDEMVGWHTDSMDMSLSNLSLSRRQWSTGKPGMVQSNGSKRVGHDWTTARSEWPSSKHLQKIKSRKGAEKRECSYIIGGNINGYNHDEEYRGSLKNYIQNY